MKTFYYSIIMMFGFVNILNSQTPNTGTTIHPDVKYLNSNDITGGYSITCDAAYKKLLSKQFKSYPIAEVYDAQGVKIKYPQLKSGKPSKGFFEPDKSVIAISASKESEGSSMLIRMANATMIDGTPLDMAILSDVEKYFIIVYWKKSTGKNGIAVMKEWQSLAADHPEYRLLWYKLD